VNLNDKDAQTDGISLGWCDYGARFYVSLFPAILRSFNMSVGDGLFSDLTSAKH
jgi:hypothetical protein